ncbi:DUF998 domain-containing protein [Streptosporangium carneum]|uniref:DUF998 domain-containing protein n=1 Tax=Streptosporangium carneum TaxID=47481 RepID=A0A9W6HXS5_9ACTN|nr:DUF998 domain-containing protein [Streptosporangium carneum]GLK07553.1 hypothetical protein GCM10017600_09580 [Streptosporangium carneum]
MLALKRLYPLIACSGIAVAVVAMIVGQVASAPRPDALDLTIGEYAAVEGSGATELAMASLAIASLALVAGLRAARAPLGTMVERLMLVWSAALTVMALVPAGVPGSAPGLTDRMHGYASVVVFFALPAAGALMVTRLGEDERWRAVARPVEWLALACGFGLVAVTYVALPGDRMLIGLAERALLVAEIALVAVLAVRLAHLNRVRGAARASRAALG